MIGVTAYLLYLALYFHTVATIQGVCVATKIASDMFNLL